MKLSRDISFSMKYLYTGKSNTIYLVTSSSFHFRSVLTFLALFLCYSPKELQKLAGKEAKYDLYAYVAFTQNGASGVANGGVVCDTRQKERISFSNAAKTWEGCKNGNCTMSQRLALTSEVYHVVESIFRHIFKPFSSHG